jgi:hypothetical protein
MPEGTDLVALKPGPGYGGASVLRFGYPSDSIPTNLNL